MLSGNLVNEYFNYLLDIVDSEEYSTDDYIDVLWLLFDTDFTWLIDHDSNRAGDGLALRDRFLSEYCDGYDKLFGPCSVLEMMVALSIRMENDIMFDPDFGNRTDIWFWKMMDSMGLLYMDYINYSYRIAKRCINNFLNRNYRPDGKGGLFVIKNSKIDMRDVEIWYQMNYAVEEIQ